MLVFTYMVFVSKKGHRDGFNSILLSALTVGDCGDFEELISRLVYNERCSSTTLRIVCT